MYGYICPLLSILKKLHEKKSQTKIWSSKLLLDGQTFKTLNL